MFTKWSKELSKEQEAIEMERNTKLECAPLKSMYAGLSSQTIAVFDGFFVYYGKNYQVVRRYHLSWEDSLGGRISQNNANQNEDALGSGDPNDSWIETFSRAL